MLTSLNIILNAFADLLTFGNDETWMGIYTYLAILIILFTVIFLIRSGIRMKDESRKWIYIFLADGILAIGLALVSHWVFMNGVNRRYFFGSYISLSLVFLIVTDHFPFEKIAFSVLRSSIFITVFTGALSTILFLKFVWPKSLRPQVELYAEFNRFGKIGIIADYWHSYIASCSNPAEIIATPHDQEYVRNRELADLVFTQPKIFVIRDNWLDSFPDSLNQFGHSLYKKGSPLKIGTFNVCEYNLIRSNSP